MNSHLNLFRFFNESPNTEFIENNLSRAFALCLANNPLFLNEYISNIVSEADYQYLFSTLSSDTKYEIDLQVNTSTIDMEAYKTIYAIAMTTDKNLNFDDWHEQDECTDKNNITDILICIKDIAIIIEVKRTGENCKAQLYNQVLPFIKEPNKYTVHPIRYSWQDVIKLLEKVKHVHQLVDQKSVFINDFLELSEIRYPEWFEPKPFNIIPFSSQVETTNYVQLQKRMRQSLAGISAIAGDEYQLLPYYDRLGISVPLGWASELIPDFETHNDNIKEYVTFYIWPGNTKQQGHSIYYKPLDWLNSNTLLIDNLEYELDIYYNVKLCHFNKYISGLTFTEADLFKPLHTRDNFYNQSGKWDCENWDDFEKLMDQHFKPEFKWREKCDWHDNFINTDRSYFTMSLGFEVLLYIPFSTFKHMDKKEDDIKVVSDFIYKIVKAFKDLI